MTSTKSGPESSCSMTLSCSSTVVVFVGFVVEVFVVGLGGDGGVDFFLAGDALFPPFFVQILRGSWPAGVSFAGDLPFFPGVWLSEWFSCWRRGGRFAESE